MVVLAASIVTKSGKGTAQKYTAFVQSLLAQSGLLQGRFECVIEGDGLACSSRLAAICGDEPHPH